MHAQSCINTRVFQASLVTAELSALACGEGNFGRLAIHWMGEETQMVEETREDASRVSEPPCGLSERCLPPRYFYFYVFFLRFRTLLRQRHAGRQADMELRL